MAKSLVHPRIVPSRDDRYMGLAFWMASFSKDPNTQIGAILVSDDNHVLGTGYNGPPRGIDDKSIDWDRTEKRKWMVHAEINAILHASRDHLKNSVLYVTAPPCTRCILEVIAVGVKRVVCFPIIYDPNSSINPEEFEKTKEMTSKAGLTFVEFSGNLNWMRDYCHVMTKKGIFG